MFDHNETLEEARARNVRDALFEDGAVGHRAGLVRSNGADAALGGAGGEVGVGLAVGDAGDAAPDADLAAPAFPVEAERS